jgi:transposase
MSRRKFNIEFKQDAMNLVLEQGLSIPPAAADLGIGVSTLDKWLRDYRARKEDPNKLSPTEFEELKSPLFPPSGFPDFCLRLLLLLHKSKG